jgi:hypothetical protein
MLEGPTRAISKATPKETGSLRVKPMPLQVVPDRHCAENLTEILQVSRFYRCKVLLSGVLNQRVRCTSRMSGCSGQR